MYGWDAPGSVIEMSNVWDRIFREKGQVFDEPDTNMPRVAKLLRLRGARRVLDLGCGTGRHMLYFAEKMYDVYGIDSSPEALRRTKMLLESRDFKPRLKLGSIYDKLPYRSAYFDAVIATNTIHHAMRDEIEAAVEEVARVMKKGGLLYAAFPMKAVGRREKTLRKKAREIAPNTFFPTEGQEAGLIHYIFDKTAIYEVFYQFDLDIWDNGHHWCILGEKE